MTEVYWSWWNQYLYPAILFFFHCNTVWLAFFRLWLSFFKNCIDFFARKLLFPFQSFQKRKILLEFCEELCISIWPKFLQFDLGWAAEGQAIFLGKQQLKAQLFNLRSSKAVTGPKIIRCVVTSKKKRVVWFNSLSGHCATHGAVSWEEEKCKHQRFDFWNVNLTLVISC